MKKLIALFFFITFLAVNTCQIYKCINDNEYAVENSLDNDEEKKSMEDFMDFFKDKHFLHTYINVPTYSFKLKQYIDHIFQYTNPSHAVDILPPEFII